MNQLENESVRKLAETAGNGDDQAFDALVEPLRQPLFAFIYRIIAERDAAEDLLQQTLLRAYQNLLRFRGEASFKTWLFQIATNACLDYLRQKSRWRFDAQLCGEQETDSDSQQLSELKSLMSRADFAYEIREHVAFCFACIGRTLAPEEQAAITLREVVGLSNQEAAQAMQISEPVFRHKLSAARRTMTEIYEGMCALINKQGTCNQCRSLREFAPVNQRGENFVQITVRRGVEITPESLFDERLQIVRQADLENGASADLHTAFFAGLSLQEEAASLEDN